MKLIIGLLLSIQCSLVFSAVSDDYLKTNFKGMSYVPVFRSCLLKEYPVTQIRQFKMNSTDYAVVVNDETITTSVEILSDLKDCRQQDYSSNYQRALISETADELDTLRNAGATHEINTNQSMYLTIDLCPSHKPMDIDLFKKIQGGVKPVPVAISISGLWLLKHTQDFNSLLDMQKSGEISIIWVNHTFDHPYNPKLPNEHNFVLLPGVKIADEVFENEKLLLQNGIVPSVFFRFPGLISNHEDVGLLRRWGLIPLGANAWLARGEKPEIGSFILVHGNGNEPVGLKILYSILAQFPNMKNEFSAINKAFQ